VWTWHKRTCFERARVVKSANDRTVSAFVFGGRPLLPLSLPKSPIDIANHPKTDRRRAGDQEGLQRLQYLCDRIGNRVSGSESLERAIEWAAAENEEGGLENVGHLRSGAEVGTRQESATLLSPVQKPLTMIGLG